LADDQHTSLDGTAPLRLAAVGFGATAVSFGPARMGFGLFLPQFEAAFDLSTRTAGLIASGAFATFLLALPPAAWLAGRIGPRAPVSAGALFAAAGCALVATAQGTEALAAGAALAAASAGFCWTPFNDAAERMAPPGRRAGALSAVATGSTTGVAAAGALGLAVAIGGLDWREAWALFSAAGALAAIAAIAALPRGSGRAMIREPEDASPALGLWRPSAARLYAAAGLFGATNAVYLAFAAERVVETGGLPGLDDGAAAAALFVGYGACGLVGLATGRIERAMGLPALLSAIFAAFAASLALLAAAPESWPGVVASAGLHGAGVMTISATLSFWSLRLFPGRASLGLTAALVAMAAGSVAGPAAAGRLIAAVGAADAFLLLAAPAGAAALGFGASALRGRAQAFAS
jgi:predicted MFS family arabinose efflux permease